MLSWVVNYGHTSIQLSLSLEGSPPRGPSNSFKISPPSRLPSCKHTAPVTPLESALVEVLIPKYLKSLRMNTYEKQGGGGTQIAPFGS
jgi:hypothetical protein